LIEEKQKADTEILELKQKLQEAETKVNNKKKTIYKKAFTKSQKIFSKNTNVIFRMLALKTQN